VRLVYILLCLFNITSCAGAVVLMAPQVVPVAAVAVGAAAAGAVAIGVPDNMSIEDPRGFVDGPIAKWWGMFLISEPGRLEIKTDRESEDNVMPHLWEKNEGVYCMSKDIERPEYKVLTGPVSLFETMAYTANRNFTDQVGCSFGEESEKPFLIAAKKYLQQVYADSDCTILESTIIPPREKYKIIQNEFTESPWKYVVKFDCAKNLLDEETI
jgi:hypothetical protein